MIPKQKEIEVTLKGTLLETSKLSELLGKIPGGGGPEVAIVSGRMPTWAFAAIVHKLHPFAAVAVFDPRLNGGVIVSSHIPDYKVGDVIPCSGQDVIKIEM